MDGDDVQLGLDVVQAALRPRALAQSLEQAGELVAPVQPDALVADQVAERGDALDVVAEVGRGAVGTRVAVVDDRERASPGGGGGGRVRVGGDPRPHPVALAVGLVPRVLVLARVAVEALVDLPRELALAVAEDRREHVVPGLRPHLGRVVGHQRAELGQHLVGRHGQARAHVLGDREARPGLARHGAQQVPGQLGVALAVGHDPARQPAQRLRLGMLAQPQRERAGAVVLAVREQRAHLRDQRVVEGAAALERAQQRLAGRRLVGRRALLGLFLGGLGFTAHGAPHAVAHLLQLGAHPSGRAV